MKVMLAALAASLAAAAQAGNGVTPVAEPGAAGLLAFGAIAAVYLVRRRK